MRRPIVVGNWKMNMLISSSRNWVEELLNTSDCAGTFDIVVAPPFTSLSVVRQVYRGEQDPASRSKYSFRSRRRANRRNFSYYA